LKNIKETIEQKDEYIKKLKMEMEQLKEEIKSNELM